jgi:hypothetical protein
MNELNWVKSSYSTATSGNCVEIAALPDGGRAVRDSKNPGGAVLLLTSAQWQELAERMLRQKGQRAPGASRGLFFLGKPKCRGLASHRNNNSHLK